MFAWSARLFQCEISLWFIIQLRSTCLTYSSNSSLPIHATILLHACNRGFSFCTSPPTSCSKSCMEVPRSCSLQPVLHRFKGHDMIMWVNTQFHASWLHPGAAMRSVTACKEKILRQCCFFSSLVFPSVAPRQWWVLDPGRDTARLTDKGLKGA